MPPGEGLLPKPWQDREIAEYRWTVPGSEDAWSISHIASSPRDRGIDTIRLHYFLPAAHTLHVDVESNSMRPTAVTNDGLPRRAGASASAYEAAEVPYLLRRQALAPGIHGDLALNLPDGEPATAQFKVETVEEVTVPAGKFSCNRVRLSTPRPHISILEGTWPVPADGEILWFSTGAGHSLVKMALGRAVGELTALRIADPFGQTVQRDPALGYSFVLPSDWIQHTRISPDRQETTIVLYPVESDLSIRILLMPATRESLGAAAAARIRTLAARQPGYSVRGPIANTTLAGHSAASWIADFGQTAEFGVCVRGASSLATITVQAPASEFERQRARFQPILDSFRLR
jgi:hypothetical protein